MQAFYNVQRKIKKIILKTILSLNSSEQHTNFLVKMSGRASNDIK